MAEKSARIHPGPTDGAAAPKLKRSPKSILRNSCRKVIDEQHQNSPAPPERMNSFAATVNAARDESSLRRENSTKALGPAIVDCSGGGLGSLPDPRTILHTDCSA